MDTPLGEVHRTYRLSCSALGASLACGRSCALAPLKRAAEPCSPARVPLDVPHRQKGAQHEDVMMARYMGQQGGGLTSLLAPCLCQRGRDSAVVSASLFCRRVILVGTSSVLLEECACPSCACIELSTLGFLLLLERLCAAPPAGMLLSSVFRAVSTALRLPESLRCRSLDSCCPLEAHALPLPLFPQTRSSHLGSQQEKPQHSSNIIEASAWRRWCATTHKEV